MDVLLWLTIGFIISGFAVLTSLKKVWKVRSLL